MKGNSSALGNNRKSNESGVSMSYPKENKGTGSLPTSPVSLSTSEYNGKTGTDGFSKK